MDCHLPANPPLVSLLVLTCNRPAFLRLALSSIAAQTYTHVEAIVVDDGKHAAQTRSLAKSQHFPVRMVRMSSRQSIGRKRNAGLGAVRGSVIAHWDDDDIRDHRHVEALVCPIVTNVAEFTSLTFSFLARLSTSSMSFYPYSRPGATSRSATGPFLGTLAYARRVAESLSRGGTMMPFANVSLSEDVEFAERALAACFRMLPLAHVPIVYTRHASVHNTWRPADFDAKMRQPMVSPPSFVGARVPAAYMAAEREAVRLGACKVMARREPAGLRRPLRFPYMPAHCCRSGLGRAPRPCTDAAPGQSCGDENFCGAQKGRCTATCTCPGEASHDAPEALPCGGMCCQFWHAFWRRHARTNCSLPRRRPLKSIYCRGEPE